MTVRGMKNGRLGDVVNGQSLVSKNAWYDGFERSQPHPKDQASLRSKK